MATYRQTRSQQGQRTGWIASVRLHAPDYQIVLFMGLLMLIGLIIMYAIGPQRANVLNTAHNTTFYTSTYFVVKQSASLALAMAAFWGIAFMPLDWIKRYAGGILMGGLVACVLLMLFGNVLGIEQIAQCSLGACRWFDLGPLGSFQPAELLKFGLLVYLAGFLAARIRTGEINALHRTIIPALIVSSIALFFTIVIQKDMGTGITIIALVGSMLMVGGVNKQIGLLIIGGVIAAGLLMVVTAPHRMARLETFLQGDSSKIADGERGDNYHIQHAKIAIGSGGFFGVGIGNSVQATGYLPEAINDSVFAIIGETFGFVGLMMILGLFTALLLRLLKICTLLIDPWAQLIVAGVFGWLASHVVLNIASMIGVFPLTGITLPLLSFGGTSMVFIAGVLGLAFQLSRYTVHRAINEEEAYEDSGSRWRIRRTRYAGRRSAR